MEETSLEQIKEKFIFHLERNEFENSILFLEKFVTVTNKELETEILSKPETVWLPDGSRKTNDRHSPKNKKQMLLLIRNYEEQKRQTEMTELCLEYYFKLISHIETYDFSDSTEKYLFLNCFKTLDAIYNPNKEYRAKYTDAGYNEDDYVVEKDSIAKSFFDFYFLSKSHCIVDSSYPEYLELEEDYKRIMAKYEEHYRGFWDCPDDPNPPEVDTRVPDGFLTEKETNLRKLMTYKEDYKVNFTPHNGKLVKEIIEDTPKQFLDLLINLHHFSVYESILMDEKLMNCDTFLKALIRNRIKRLYQIKLDKERKEQAADDYRIEMAVRNEGVEYDIEQENIKNSNSIDHDILDAFEGDSSNMWNVD